MFESTASASSEYGWPCQRIRLGIGLLLFTAFELTIAQQIPLFLMMIISSIGIGCLISAALSLQEVRLKMQIAMLGDAMTQQRRSSSTP